MGRKYDPPLKKRDAYVSDTAVHKILQDSQPRTYCFPTEKLSWIFKSLSAATATVSADNTNMDLYIIALPLQLPSVGRFSNFLTI